MLAEFLEETFGQQTGDLITRLLLGVAILAATWLVREIVTAIIPALIRKVTRRTRITWDDQIVRVIRPPLRFLIVVYGLWFAIRVLEPPAELEATAEQIMRTLVVIGIFWAIYRAVDPAFRILFRVSRRTMRDSAVPDLLDRKLSSAITQVAKGLVIVFAFATVLETWHYNVAGLIAGLGIAGAAVALAVKDTLANLFAYFVILADEPFTLGDYVVFGDVAGTVENIGFRSSRIRALDQSLVTVPNNTVMNANVTNWSRLTKRRLNMTLRITRNISSCLRICAIAFQTHFRPRRPPLLDWAPLPCTASAWANANSGLFASSSAPALLASSRRRWLLQQAAASSAATLRLTGSSACANAFRKTPTSSAQHQTNSKRSPPT